MMMFDELFVKREAIHYRHMNIDEDSGVRGGGELRQEGLRPLKRLYDEVCFEDGPDAI